MKYLQDCLNSNWVSSVGPYVDRFEKEMSGFVGVKHAVACVNGTSALHLALLVSGVQPNDEVLVPSLSFIAPANAVRYVGAWPVFMDADPTHWQMDPGKVLDFLKKECQWRKGNLYNKHTHRRVRAILPVHLLGHPVDMDPLLKMARKFKLTVIEDAAESLGAKYKSRNVGSLGDIACFSFNGNKLITCGGGGMIVTKNKKWAERAKYLSTQAKDNAFRSVHGSIGYNYRLTNIQAAVGCAQMKQLHKFIENKRRTAERYNFLLKNLSITPMQEADWAIGTFWLYTVLLDKGNRIENLINTQKYFLKHNIQVRSLPQPIHLSPAHAGCFAYHCDTAEEIYRRGISLPCSVGIKSKDIQDVVTVMRKHLN